MASAIWRSIPSERLFWLACRALEIRLQMCSVMDIAASLRLLVASEMFEGEQGSSSSAQKLIEAKASLAAIIFTVNSILISIAIIVNDSQNAKP